MQPVLPTPGDEVYLLIGHAAKCGPVSRSTSRVNTKRGAHREPRHTGNRQIQSRRAVRVRVHGPPEIEKYPLVHATSCRGGPAATRNVARTAPAASKGRPSWHALPAASDGRNVHRQALRLMEATPPLPSPFGLVSAPAEHAEQLVAPITPLYCPVGHAGCAAGRSHQRAWAWPSAFMSSGCASVHPGCMHALAASGQGRGAGRAARTGADQVGTGLIVAVVTSKAEAAGCAGGRLVAAAWTNRALEGRGTARCKVATAHTRDCAAAGAAALIAHTGRTAHDRLVAVGWAG